MKKILTTKEIAILRSLTKKDNNIKDLDITINKILKLEVK